MDNPTRALEAAAVERSWVITFAVAVPLAIALPLLGVALVLVVKAPGSGLLAHLWRVPLDESYVWFQAAIGAALLVWAGRPVSHRAAVDWLTARRLPEELARAAAAELRRSRVWRFTAAIVGFSGGIGTAAAVNLSIAVDGHEAPALMAAATGQWPYPVLLALGGYVLGAVGAEVHRAWSGAPSASAGARLEARRPEHYLTRFARWLPDLTAAAVLLVAGVRVLMGTPFLAMWAELVVAAWLVIGVRAVQWWVVRRPQRLSDQDALAFDDTLRSSVAHAVVGGSCAIGLMSAGGLFNGTGWWNAYVAGQLSGWLVVPLTSISCAVGIAMLVVWIYYGTRHPGNRPAAK